MPPCIAPRRWDRLKAIFSYVYIVFSCKLHGIEIVIQSPLAEAQAFLLTEWVVLAGVAHQDVAVKKKYLQWTTSLPLSLSLPREHPVSCVVYIEAHPSRSPIHKLAHTILSWNASQPVIIIPHPIATCGGKWHPTWPAFAPHVSVLWRWGWTSLSLFIMHEARTHTHPHILKYNSILEHFWKLHARQQKKKRKKKV